MFKVLPFFQKHFRKCGIPAYINQQSFFPTGLLGPSYGDSPSPTTSEQTETEVSKNSPCSTSSRQFNSSCATSSGEQGQPSHLQTIDSLIDSLRPLEKITLVRTRVVRKSEYALTLHIAQLDNFKLFQCHFCNIQPLDFFTIRELW